ncbi:MAG TPA: tRNA (adenosine(37)-N6)-dimethylallyltransferase MiaA [Polyangia bacterium]|jgi:tRNA dimethylallyltransferase|nr:tRNA (adenosine(37)-N6)-dimethylallyltransferase MiaA [Polyangia bacterium]
MVIAILGPTASGKSELGLALAQRLSGEIVCCDSMQVYRGMDIGTGKATKNEQTRCPHHLLDLVDPGEPFHAAAWAARARTVIDDIHGRGRTPIIVGGTGLYFRALRVGLFDAPAPDPTIRARHQAEAAAQGVPALHQRLRGIDPDAAARILPGDLVRTSRALEVYEQTGIPISELRRRAVGQPLPGRLFVVVLDYPLDKLRLLIQSRVERMMAAGFLAEVEALRLAGFGHTRALAALGYKQLGQHLDGPLTLEEAVAQTKTATSAYARRQRTWFRREQADLRPSAPPNPDTIVRDLSAHL